MGFQGTADEEDDDRQYDDQRQEVNHESENPGEWRASSPGVVNVYPIHLVVGDASFDQYFSQRNKAFFRRFVGPVASTQLILKIAIIAG